MSGGLNDSELRPDVSSEVNLQKLHASITREYNDPRDGLEGVPFWMTCLFGGLLFWGGMYMSSYSADYRPDVYDRPDAQAGSALFVKKEELPKSYDEYFKLGQRIYNNCAGCHQATGDGNPGGGIPPLNNSEWVSGEKNSAARLSRILLYGLNGQLEVLGKSYNGQMPAWGGQLKDHQIAGVLTYIRTNWDNKPKWPKPEDGMITTEQVVAARAKVGASSPSMTQPTLEAIPVTYKDGDAGGAMAAPAAGATKKEEPKKADAKK